MQKLSAILLAAALSALVPMASYAADQANTVKPSSPPYKPGRQIEGEASPDAAAAPSAAQENDSKTVKPGAPPYKPGRQVDDASAQGASPAAAEDDKAVKSGQPPYKPGRQTDEKEEGKK